MRAWLNLRYAVPERRKAFSDGFKRLGYRVEQGFTNKPKSGDVLVTWNRIGVAHKAACDFEAAGCQVLVTENASWGNDFNGERWYHIARTRHNTRGLFPVGGPERWDDLGVSLPPIRDGGEVVILPQRGLGSPPTAMPKGWPGKMQKKTGARVRPHPGKHRGIPLEEDLADCGTVLTWGSGAAIKAMLLGCRVKSWMPDWIGEQDNTPEDRLRMFRELAWAQWTLEEIASGLPFRRLL